MAIRRRGAGGATPSQELRHFTDREDVSADFVRLFEESGGVSLPVLMFYGVGGMGKSWLLKHIRTTVVEGSGRPSAFIDLEASVGGAKFHGDISALLAEIWLQFDVECPRFELAFTMMRFKQGAADKPLLRHSGKVSTAWELFAEGGEALLSNFPGGNLIVWLGSKVAGATAAKLKDTALGKRLLSAAGNDDYLRLFQMDAQEIYPLLAERLGQDLDEQLPMHHGKSCRAVVFLDTFEALRAGAQGPAQQQLAEEPVQELYRNLTSVLLVIAGRDRLTWHEIDRDWADPASLEQHRLRGLDRRDVSTFLEQCGIGQGSLQEAIMRISVDEKAPDRDAYYPFSLGLCADLVSGERLRGGEPDPATFDMAPNEYGRLAQRFLKSLHDRHTELWITMLAQTPRFDEDAARDAFSSVRDVQQDAAWDALRNFSFVQEAGHPGWFRLHSRMSDVLRQRVREPRAFAQAHTRWQEYWHARAHSDTDDLAALAWYHEFALDPARARQTWKHRADQVRARAKMALHNDLLDWWASTDIEDRPPRSQAEAAALIVLGAELVRSRLGDRSAKLHRAIACYESVLRIYTEAEFPADWATAQNNLGAAYGELQSGDRGQNLRRAIACYEAALRVYTEADFPTDWARSQNNLGLAWRNLPTGNRGDNLRKAINHFEAALRVRTEADYPDKWAGTINNLGVAFWNLPTGSRGENLRRAIACFEAALRVYTEADFPEDWAVTQSNLGNAYLKYPLGDRGENLRLAICYYEAALRVRTEAEFPLEWAGTQHNLGIAYRILTTGDRGENLRRAISCYEAALRVYIEADFPADWARTRYHLAIVYHNLPTGDRGEDLKRAIAHYKAALRVYTETDFPDQRALVRSLLALALRDLRTSGE
jgi:tetratricopeptide (TPR) repeat protein